jgi:hypothetical protein
MIPDLDLFAAAGIGDWREVSLPMPWGDQRYRARLLAGSQAEVETLDAGSGEWVAVRNPGSRQDVLAAIAGGVR